MPNSVFKEVYPVEERNGKFFVKRGINLDKEVRFLVRNPKDNELFLLLGGMGSYSLLKGSVEKGLRFCIMHQSTLFADCFAFTFEQDGIYGSLNDPADYPLAKPSYDCMTHGESSVDLELVDYEISTFQKNIIKGEMMNMTVY